MTSAGLNFAMPHPTVASLRNAVYASMIIALPALCFIASLVRVEVFLALLFLAIALVVVVHAAASCRAKASGFILLFFVCAVAHAIFGFLMAPASSLRIWIGTGADRFYDNSFLVIAVGIVAAAAGYAITANKRFPRVRNMASSFDATDHHFIWIARIVILAGAALMFTIYIRLGLVPLLTGNPGQSRYFTSQTGEDYVMTEWLVARGLDLLMFGLPLVFVSAKWRKTRWDWLLGIIGFLALLLPLRRANALSVLFVLLVMGALRANKAAGKRCLAALLLVVAYGISQLLLYNLIGLQGFEVDTGLSVLGSSLPEVRDLGWTIELLDGEHLQGETFVQALVPVPSFVSDFSQKSGLRAITSRLIGLDVERITGGLRLTLAGEAYLNFDYFGTVCVGFLFGMACSVVQVLIATLRSRGTIWAWNVAAVVLVWVCFWVYLGGTQAAATVKIGTLLLGVSLLVARKRNMPAEVAA